MGDAALQLNVYDPDITGFLGLFTAACGQGATALPLLQRSVDLDASYAGVPAVTLAFMLAQNGEVERALAILDHMPSPSNLERSEEHTSELQSLMRLSYAVSCLKTKTHVSTTQRHALYH